jgi:REP element-mobilizing transposase RayT
MSDTFYSINIHFIFGTKQRMPMITEEMRDRLHAFIGGILRKHGLTSLSVGGTDDHVHIVTSLPTTISVSKVAQLVKGGSSRWVHDTFPEKRAFSWQKGYGAFSVSVSQLSKTAAYVGNQVKHHRSLSFREEFLALLSKNKVNYDESNLWE